MIEPVINSNENLTPEAKVAVICASMAAVSASLVELSKLCDQLGQPALGHEAKTIEQAFAGRRKALLTLTDQMGGN